MKEKRINSLPIKEADFPGVARGRYGDSSTDFAGGAGTDDPRLPGGAPEHHHGRRTGLAHGANNNIDQPLLTGLHERLARAGLATVRFNFPYAEAGRKRPDPDEALEGAFRLALEYVGEIDELKGLALYLGGKSMGARLAAQLVAKEVGASGLVFLGYPLHPPGQTGAVAGQPPIGCPARRCSLEASGTFLSHGSAGKCAGPDACQ